jgi:DNA-binding MarR family transcriptional regulator
MRPAVPMARLLAMGYELLIDGLHERLQDDGYTDVKPSFGFVLLAIRAESTTTTDLALSLGITKQAVSKLLDAMETAGYVARTTDEVDGRIKVVELTSQGHVLLTDVERIYVDLEAEWASIIGTAQLEQTRRRLTKVVVASHGGKLPVIRPPSGGR